MLAILDEPDSLAMKVLDNLGVEYYHVDHRDMPADTMEACVAVDKALDCKICKNQPIFILKNLFGYIF